MKTILEEYINLCKEFEIYEQKKIPLCAAETYISNFSKQPLLSDFEGKYSFVDKFGNNSFIGGNFIEQLNHLLSKECFALFGASYTNADTLTGINCFTVCAMSLLTSGDTVLLTTPEQGGHASMPTILKTLGIKYDSIPYSYEDYQIDYKGLNKLCQSNKYDAIIFCQSDIINPPDLHKLEIPENMPVIYDGTQTLGLIIGKMIQNPLNFSNVILIGGTHKTLPAPSCGLIMTNNKMFEQKLKSNITPVFLRNTQPNHIACLLLGLIEQEKFGKTYQKKIVTLANQLGRQLENQGFEVAKANDSAYTFTHQLFMLMSENDADIFYQNAKKYNITLNQKHKKLFHYDGIRLGTQQIARYNWSDTEISCLTNLLYFIASDNPNKQQIIKLRNYLISQKIPQFEYDEIIIE